MKNEATDHGDLYKLGELIGDIEVAMLTTRATDGSLMSRPLQTLKLDAHGELIFFTAAGSHKVDQLTDDSSVNLAYADPDKQRYVSVRGRARMDRDVDTIEELWSAPQKIFFPAGKEDPNLMVLRVRVVDAAYWEAAGSFIARALDFAHGMLSDSPEDLGKHGHLDG
jgi:general stress protein 26